MEVLRTHWEILFEKKKVDEVKMDDFRHAKSDMFDHVKDKCPANVSFNDILGNWGIVNIHLCGDQDPNFR